MFITLLVTLDSFTLIGIITDVVLTSIVIATATIKNSFDVNCHKQCD